MPSPAYKISDLARLLGARTVIESDAVITGIGTLETASGDQLSFLHRSIYQDQLATSEAGAVLVRDEDSDAVTSIALIVDDPYLAYARATELFRPQRNSDPVVCPTARISESATIAEDVCIGSNVVVGENTVIGAGVVVEANTVIGCDCSVGDNSFLAPNVTLYNNVQVGSDCIIHSGAVIGADGFGFAPKDKGWVKIHQLGGVVVGDNVEIGASTTIDRGALDNTVIEDGVKLDNQIQIGHNTVIGENTAIAACTAIAGSTRIGKSCTIAGACAIAGHLTITDGTHITGMSMVSRSISKAGAYSSGTAAEPHKQWKRNVVRFRQLDDLFSRVKELESQIKQHSSKGQSE